MYLKMKLKHLLLFCILLLPSVNALSIEPDVVFEVGNTNYNFNTIDFFNNVTINDSLFGVDNCYVNFTAPTQLNVTVIETKDYKIMYNFKNNVPNVMNVTFYKFCSYPANVYVQNVRVYTNTFELDTEQSVLMFINPLNYTGNPNNPGGSGILSGDYLDVYLEKNNITSSIQPNKIYIINITLINDGAKKTGDVELINDNTGVTLYLKDNMIFNRITLEEYNKTIVPIYIQTQDLEEYKNYVPIVKFKINGHELIYNINLTNDVSIKYDSDIIMLTSTKDTAYANTKILIKEKPTSFIVFIIVILLTIFITIKILKRKK